jgi:hypothetical protein
MTKNWASRKRRLKRLPFFGSQSFGGFNFNPTAADWARIEAAYGVSLLEEDRTVIVLHVICYLRDEPQEGFAPFANDAARWLDGVHGAADALLRKLRWWKGDDIKLDSDRERGCAYAQMLLATNLRHQPFSDWPNDKVEKLHGLISQVVNACTSAKDDVALRAEAGEREGWFWDHLIRELTAFAKQRNFPIGAAKGTDKQKTPRASPFVAFVRELQNVFPEQARRHMSSDAALAKAITDARRRPKAKMDAGQSTER